MSSELKPLQHYFFDGIACISTFYKNLEILLKFDLGLNELMVLKTQSSQPRTVSLVDYGWPFVAMSTS